MISLARRSLGGGGNGAGAIALKSYSQIPIILATFSTHRPTTLMKFLNIIYAFIGLGMLVMAGCQTQQQMLQGSQGLAIQTAVNRARFDMNCSSASGQVLSTNVSQPSIQGTFVNAYGVQRLEYTVGVRGCGQRRTYIVVCPQGGAGCFAAQAL